MKRCSALVLVTAALLAGAEFDVCKAALLEGGISLGGGVGYNTGNVNDAIAFTGFNSVYVTSVSGDFSGAGITMNAPGSVAMNGFSFNPFPAAGVIPLWQTVTGTYARFDLTSLNSREQNGDDVLKLFGEGTLYMTGYDPTPGSWIFTGQQGGNTFSFSASQVAVPEPGTMALLILGAVALVSGRRS